MKKKRVLITNPPWHYTDAKGKQHFGIRAGSRWPHTIPVWGGYKPFPFFMAYAVSNLRMMMDAKVDMVDAIANQMTYKQFIHYVIDFRPDYLVLETSSPSWINDLNVIGSINCKFNEMGRTRPKIIVVGQHPTNFGKKIIEQNVEGIDIAIKGDYELTLTKVIQEDLTGFIDYNPVLFENPQLPYRDDKSIWLYQERTHGKWGINSQTGKQISVQTSRGCPFLCDFCVWIHGMFDKKIRYRNIENVKDELNYIKTKYGQEVFIYFDDDTFNLKKSRTKFLSDYLGYLGFNWSFMGRIDASSIEEWDFMIKNGLKAVNVGIESGSQKIVNNMHKKLDLGEAEDTIDFLTKSGVYVHTTWGIQYDGENEDEIEETFKARERFNDSSNQISVMMPLPGTPFYEREVEKGNIDDNAIFDGGMESLEKISEKNSKLLVRINQTRKGIVHHNF